MTKKGKIYLSADLYADNSPIDGKGLFTSTEIKKGEYLFTAKGAYVHLEKKKNTPLLRWVDLSSSKWKIEDTKNPVVYLNHSCTPNIAIGRNFIITALRPIEANEELLLDYSTVELDSKWKLNCKCDSIECRGTIKGYNALPQQIKNNFKQFMPLRVIMDIPVFTYR